MASATVTAILSATVGVISLCYNVSKDAYAYLHKKVQYSKNLEMNYEALYWELDFLRGLRADIERYIQRKGLMNPPLIFKNWNDRVLKVDREARTLFTKYTDTRYSWVFRRAKLSRKMVKLLEKIDELKRDGKEFGKLLTGNYGRTEQEIRKY